MNDTHRWDQRYASTDRLFPREPDAILIELVDQLRPGRALDLGAGEGRNSLWLARQGWQVTAVDLSQVALSRLAAEAVAEHLAVSTVHADISDYLARAEQFDLVVVANIHPTPEQRARLLAAAAAAVAPGGYLYLIGHHVDSLGLAGPPDAERLYTEERLAGAFPGLDVLRIERRERASEGLRPPHCDILAWATRRT